MCLGGKTPDLYSASSGRGRFEPAPCSWAEGLAPLDSWAAMAELATSINISGVVVEPPAPIDS